MIDGWRAPSFRKIQAEKTLFYEQDVMSYKYSFELGDSQQRVLPCQLFSFHVFYQTNVWNKTFHQDEIINDKLITFSLKHVLL